MKILYETYGIKAISICCSQMAHALFEEKKPQIKLDSYFSSLSSIASIDGTKISNCPFCGSEIQVDKIREKENLA